MEIFKLCSVLLAVTELCASLLYFLVYFLEYNTCENETDFKHLEEVLLVLLITSLLAGVLSFIYASCLLVLSIRGMGQYLAFATEKPNPYRRAFVCYRLTSILLSFLYAILSVIIGVMFLAIYACQVHEFYWDTLCAINPHLMFSTMGYYISAVLLIIYVFSIPGLILRLMPLVK